MKDTSKRYWLFTYNDYYPNGGMEDFLDSFDTLDDALVAAVKSRESFVDVQQLWDTKEHKEYFLNGNREWRINQ